MNRYTLQWAAFCAVLVPLFLRAPGDPSWVTVSHMVLAAGLVALADWRERHG